MGNSKINPVRDSIDKEKAQREQISNGVKICHVANADIAVKFLLLPQLKFLIKEGYDVHAVCSKGKWVNDIEKEGIKVKTIKIKRKISPFYDLVTLYRLWNYFRKEKFQIVHTHTPKPGLLGQLAAKFTGVPVIINTIHGLYFNKTSSFLKREFYIFIEKIAAKCSTLIFSQNGEDINTIIREKICEPQKIKYLGSGVDIWKFSPKRFSGRFVNKKKRELNLKPDFKIIGIVGRLVEEKGYLDLFDAFKTVLIKFPKTLLLIIGPKEPEKKDAINPNIVKKYGIEENVIFLGERTDVDELYPLMDIFILPSHREGFPRTIIEAMAMAKPIIATNIRGCHEAIENNKTGILIPEKSPLKLAEAITFLLENSQKSRELGENARVKAEKEFDERIVFDRIIKEYDRLLLEKIKHK